MGILSLLIQSNVKRRYKKIAEFKNKRVSDGNSLRIIPGDEPELVGADLTELPEFNEEQLQALAEGIEQSLETWLNSVVTAPPPTGKVVTPPSGTYTPP